MYVCMYVYIYIYTYIYMYIYMYTLCIYIYIRTHTRLCIFVSDGIDPTGEVRTACENQDVKLSRCGYQSTYQLCSGSYHLLYCFRFRTFIINHMFIVSHVILYYMMFASGRSHLSYDVRYRKLSRLVHQAAPWPSAEVWRGSHP